MASFDRIHRLMRLLQILQSGREPNSVQLADHCQVSRRTVFRDIHTLQDSGIPIRFDEAKQGYTVNSKTFIPPTEFTLDEVLSLIILCKELGHSQSGIPFQNPAHSASTKLMGSLPDRLRETVTEISDAIEVKMAPHNLLTGSEPFYELFQQAIVQRKQVRVQYKSFMQGEQGEISTLLNPYRLLFGKRSWYLFARSSLHREIRTFNIGRILKAEPMETTYKIPQRFSLDRHLGNAWFLIRERNNRQKIVIHFKPMVARNVAEVQWHKSQKLVWQEDGSLKFYATVDGLKEIVWWILGYGDQAEVLEPPELRQLICERIDAMHKTYRTHKTASIEKTAPTKITKKAAAKKSGLASKKSTARKK